MLNHFVTSVLPSTVRELIIFCDSCAGQNKNYTCIRYLHYLVVTEKRFDMIKVIFPIRGHSYLECDRDMSLIQQKSYVEVPDEWREVIRNSREKPSPYIVVDCKREMFKGWTDFLKPKYQRQCPMPTRPIRCIKFEKTTPRFVHHRSNYSGSYFGNEIMKKTQLKKTKATRKDQNKSQEIVYTEPKKLYDKPLPISQAKYNDLQCLKQFLITTEAKHFYENLSYDGRVQHHDDEYLDYENENDE